MSRSIDAGLEIERRARAKFVPGRASASGTFGPRRAERRRRRRRRARQSGTPSRTSAQQREALGRGDEHANAAVVEDVRDLPGLQEQRVDGTNTPPAAEVPKIDTTVSIRLSRKIATRSPFSSPSCGRPPANLRRSRPRARRRCCVIVLEREGRRVAPGACAQSATSWWSGVLIGCRCPEVSSRVSPGNADELAVQVVDLVGAQGRAAEHLPARGVEHEREPRGRVRRRAARRSVTGIRWRSSRCRQTGPGQARKSAGVAHVEDRGEQRQALAAVLAEDHVAVSAPRTSDEMSCGGGADVVSVEFSSSGPLSVRSITLGSVSSIRARRARTRRAAGSGSSAVVVSSDGSRSRWFKPTTLPLGDRSVKW